MNTLARVAMHGADLDQSGGSFGVLYLLGSANSLSQFTNRGALLVNRKLGVANDVDEQDVPNFKAKIVVGVRRHPISLAGGSSGDHDYLLSFGAREATIALRLVSDEPCYPNVKKVLDPVGIDHHGSVIARR